jgi:hypothetical protein
MFIDEYCSDNGFYKELPLDYASNRRFGQLFVTHAYYPHENLQFFRPVFDPADKTKTIAELFRIEAAGQDAFARPFPLGVPKLESNEEFLVIRAKRRPVVLLQTESPLLRGLNEGYRGKLQRHLCLVAQVFSLVDTRTSTAKFDQALVDRIRMLEFPQFMFLPRKAGVLSVDSLLRLDELQSAFANQLKPTRLALNDEPAEILQQQFRMLITGQADSEYIQLREFLMTT